MGWACIFGLGCAYPDLYKYLLIPVVIFGLILGGIVISVTAEEFKDEYAGAWIWDRVDKQYVPIEVSRNYDIEDKGYGKSEYYRRFRLDGNKRRYSTSIKRKYEITNEQKRSYFELKNRDIGVKEKVVEEVEFSVLAERGKKIWEERKKEIAREKELEKQRKSN